MSKVITLDKLLPGQTGVIFFVGATGTIKQRLLEMGFVKGAIIEVDKLAPLGDPMELILKGYHLSLRKDEASCILVKSFGKATGWLSEDERFNELASKYHRS